MADADILAGMDIQPGEFGTRDLPLNLLAFVVSMIVIPMF